MGTCVYKYPWGLFNLYNNTPCDVDCLDSPEHPCEKKKVLTNGDKIRQMTDEELRDLFGNSKFYFTCPVNISDEECTKTIDCITCFYEWLKQEAKDD